MQLSLVDRFVQLGLGTHADGVDQLTNFQRRLGIGQPNHHPGDSRWNDLLAQIDTAPTHDARVAVVMRTYESLPPAVPEHIARGWPTVGAFSIQVTGTVAHTHFFSTDDDGESPLHPSKLAQRRAELRQVITSARTEHPALARVAGGSWLYRLPSYASLFPAEHLANAEVRRGRRTFQGMSHWGQFLGYRGNIRPDLADEFRRRVAAWTGDDPCALFPIDTLELNSPITVFDSPTGSS